MHNGLNTGAFLRVNGHYDHLVHSMEDLGARVAGGDYDVSRDLPAPARDEIGRLEAFFSRFLRVVGAALSELQRRPGRDG